MKIIADSIGSGFKKIGKALTYTGAYFSYRKKMSALTGCSIKKIYGFYNEINDSDFIKKMITKSKSYLSFSRLDMLSPLRAPTIYVICRIFKPEIVIETGVADGFSTSFILRALEANEKGQLFSIDLPNQLGEKKSKDGIGWLVPEKLRHRWKLIVGPSREKLIPLLENLKKLDLFFHDSNHSYENIMFECNTAWKYLNPGGQLLVDDITENNAFRDFTELNKNKSTRLFKLGIIIKQNHEKQSR